MTGVQFRGRGAYRGIVVGEALIADCTLTGWNTFNLATGQILEKGHPLYGMSVHDRVLIVRGARGSTGWATQFLKLRHAGVGPIGMVFPELDSRTAAACVVMKVPVVTDIKDDIFQLVHSGAVVRIDGDRGLIEVLS